MKNFRLYISFFFFLLFFTVTGNATVITSKVVTGNFSTNGNWVGELAPGPADDAVIAAGAIINLTNDRTITNLIVEGSLNLNANLTITSNITISAIGQINANNRTIIVSGNWNNGNYPTGFNAGTSTVRWVGSGNPTLGFNEKFYRLEVELSNTLSMTGDIGNIVQVTNSFKLGSNIRLSNTFLRLGQDVDNPMVNFQHSIASKYIYTINNEEVQHYVNPSKKSEYKFPVGSDPTGSRLAVFTINQADKGLLGLRFNTANIATQENGGAWYATSSNGLLLKEYDLNLLTTGFAVKTNYHIQVSENGGVILPNVGNHKTNTPTNAFRLAMSHPVVNSSLRYTIRHYATTACPTISINSTPAPVCASTNFGAINTTRNDAGLTVSRQWYHNGIPISGATGTSYTRNAPQREREGAYYVETKSQCGIVRSNSVKLVVKPKPTPTFAYSHEREITINQANSTDKDSFPVVLSIPSTAFNGNNKHAKGYDVIFTDLAYNKLNHEIEQELSAGTGNLVVWIRIPKLTALPGGTKIKMLYGSTAITENPSTTGVWPAEYKGVWHMNSDTIIDATVNRNYGFNKGTTREVNGKMGAARRFDQSLAQCIRIPTHTSLEPANSVTLSCWFKPSAQTNAYAKLIHKGRHDLWPYNSFALERRNTNGYGFTLGTQDNAGGAKEAANNLPVVEDGNNWYQLVGTYDGVNMRLYINGVLRNQFPWTENIMYNFPSRAGEIFDIVLGGAQDGGIGWYQGLIDEVRILNQAKSATWIATEYANQADPAAFYTLGIELKNPDLCFNLMPNFDFAYRTKNMGMGDIYTWSSTSGSNATITGSVKNDSVVIRYTSGNRNIRLVDTLNVCRLQVDYTVVVSNPSIVAGDVQVCPGSTFEREVNVNNTCNDVIYQWQVSIDNGVNWTDLSNSTLYSGVNTTKISISNVDGLNDNRYRLKISNRKKITQIINTNSFRLKINTLTIPITSSQQVCLSGNIDIGPNISGTNREHIWEKDGVALSITGVYTLLSNGRLRITGATSAQTGTYKVLVTIKDFAGNICDQKYSNDIVLTVNPLSIAGTISGDAFVCSNTKANLSVAGSVGSITWQSSSAINGPYNNGVNPNNLVNYTSGNLNSNTFFRTKVKSGNCADAYSDTFEVKVPIFMALASGQTLCSGNDGIASISNTNLDYQYQLYSDNALTIPVGVPVAGNGGDITLSAPSNLLPTSALPIYFYLSESYGICKMSPPSAVLFTVNAAPDKNKTFYADGICAGQNASLVIKSSQSNIFYRAAIDGVLMDLSTRRLGTGQDIIINIQASLVPLGTYSITVFAENFSTGCQVYLNGSATLNVSNSATTTMSVQGSTACPGDANAPIVISDSENGVSYYAVRKNTQDTVAGPVLGNNSFANILVPVNRLTPGYNELTIAAKLPGGCAVNLLNVVEVNVNVAPNINYTLSAPKDTICPADVFPITMNSSQLGMLYRLYVGNDPATNDIQGTGVKMIFNTDVNILTPGDKIISVRVRPGDCPSDTINSKVKVHVLPIPDYSLTIQYPAVICPENTMDITVLNTQNNVVYQVFKDQDTIISNALTGNGANIIFNVTSDKLRDGLNNIMVKARLSKCYFAPMTQAAIVRKVITPKSSFSFLDKPFSVCPGIDFSFFLSGTETTDRAVKYFTNLNNVTVTDSIVGTGGSVKFTIAAANIIPGAHKIKVYARAENCAPIQLNDSAVLTAYKNPELDRSIIGDTVCPNSDALVRILNSESNLYTYQAYIDNQIAGTSRLGNNGQIGLTIPAASLAAYSDNFTMIEVRARVSTCADLSLSQQVMVKVFKDPKINLVFSSDPVCPKSPAPYSILNTESGVNYLIYQNENLIDTVKGNGGDVIDTIPASLLSVGSNTFPVNASVRYCDIKPLIVPLVIQVKPNPSQFKDLVYKDSICPNQNAIIQVVNTEENVRYALLNKNNTSISDFINGDNTNHNFIILPLDLSEGSNLLKIEAELNLCKVILDAKPNIYVVKTPLANFKVAADYFLCPGLPGEINVSGSERDALYSLWLNSKKLSDQEGSGAGMSFSVPSDSMQVGLNIFTIRSQRSVCSSVTLTDTAGILVMMTPDKNLILTGDVLCPAQNGDIAIANSETGVTYRAYLASNNKLIGQPAIGIDGGVAYISLNANELPTFDNIIKVRATFSNCASIELVDTALMKIRKAPELDKKLIGDSKCPTSTTARITVKETEPGIKYRAYLELSGLVLSSLMTGNGGDIILNIPIAQLNNGNNSIIITANAGCADFNLSNKANVRLSEFPLLDLGVVSDKICIGGQAAVTVLNSEAGIQYQLYRGTQPVSDIYTGTGNNIRIDITDPQSNLPVGTNNFTIIATNECNSKDLVNSANVVVDRNSVGGFALGDVEQICAGSDGGIIKLSGIVGKVLRWIGSTDTIVWTNYEIPSSVFDVPELFESQYYKAVVKSGACPADTSTMIFIKVNPAPREDLKMKGDSVCEGSSAIIALLNYEPEMTYQLRRSPADTIVKAPTRVVGQDLIFDLSNMNSTGTFFIMASSNGECGVKLPARATVFVKPNPKPVFTGDFKLGCDEIVVNYNLESLPGHYYFYSVVGGRILSQTTNQSDVKIRWEIDVTKETPHLIYLYDSIPASGCKVTNKYEVKYQDTELPVLSCPDMIHRDILRTDVDSFIRYSVVGYELDPLTMADQCGIVSITNDYNEGKSLKDSVITLPIVDEEHVYQKTIRWTISDYAGFKAYCSVKAEFRIIDEILPVTAFSPNSDGTNDTWKIKVIERYPDAIVSVYTRFGEKVFESPKGYPNEWDGTYKGMVLPPDTYHYMIQINGLMVKRGMITILTAY